MTSLSSDKDVSPCPKLRSYARTADAEVAAQRPRGIVLRCGERRAGDGRVLHHPPLARRYGITLATRGSGSHSSFSAATADAAIIAASSPSCQPVSEINTWAPEFGRGIVFGPRKHTHQILYARISIIYESDVYVSHKDHTHPARVCAFRGSKPILSPPPNPERLEQHRERRPPAGIQLRAVVNRTGAPKRRGERLLMERVRVRVEEVGVGVRGPASGPGRRSRSRSCYGCTAPAP